METERELSQLQHHLLQQEYDILSVLCKDIVHTTHDANRLCLVYYYYALAQIKMNMYEQAIGNLLICSERLKKEVGNHKLIQAFVELEIAFSYNNSNNEELVSAHANESLRLFDELHDNDGKSRSYLVLGTAYFIRSKIQQSIDVFQKGLECTTNNTKDTRARILLNLSSCYNHLLNDEYVLSYSKQALNIIDECDEINSSAEKVQTEGMLQRTPLGYARMPYKLSHIKSQCYGSISNILSSVGLFDRAVEYMNKGIDIASKSENRQLIAEWKHNLSNTLLEFGMAQDARLHLTDALTHLQTDGSDFRSSLVEYNLGRCFFFEGEYAQALELFETSKQSAVSIANHYASAVICYYISKTHSILDNTQLAKQYLQEGFEYANQLEDDYMRVCLQMEEARHLMIANDKKAIPLLQNILERWKATNNKKEEIETVELLAEAYGMFNLHKQSKEYYQQLLALQKQIFTTRSHQQITSLSVLHRTETLQLEKKLLQEREQSLHQERDYLQTQLTMKTNGMLEQLKAVNQLRTEVLDSLRDIDSAEAILSKVKKKLNASSVLRQDWNSFAEVFNQVHPSFVKNLTSQYPHLTKMEVRICILLRTGMSTDDMAQLLYLSDRSIESHRLHLRKKLNLQRNDSLFTILSML